MIIQPYDYSDVINTLTHEPYLYKPDDLNEMFWYKNIVFMEYYKYYRQLDNEEKAFHPKDFSVPHHIQFGRYDEKKDKIIVVIHGGYFEMTKRFPDEVLQRLHMLLTHESIHVQQHKRMSPEYERIISDPFNFRLEYLEDKQEIMAYAYSIVDEIKSSGGTLKDLFHHQLWYQGYVSTSLKTRKRLLKYAYLYFVS